MSESMQQWIRWISAVIIIPLVSIICYQVFDNKANIAVLENSQGRDRELLKEIYQNVKVLTPTVIRMDERLNSWEPAR